MACRFLSYKAEIASLLHYNATLLVSDGLQAHMGSVTANQEWFKVWRTIYGAGAAPKSALELEVLVRGKLGVGSQILTVYAK